MYPDGEMESIKLADDEDGIHLALFNDDQLMSVISLFRQEDYLQFRKFATVVASQQKGYGSLLLQQVMDYAATEGFARVWCNARKSAVGFYKKFGLTETPQTLEKGGISYVIMEKIYRH